MRMLTREKISRFSSTCTRWPMRAASTAARRPTGPAPLMTTRLVVLCASGRVFQFSASICMSDFVLCGTSEPAVALMTTSKPTRPEASSGTPQAARRWAYAATASRTSSAARKVAQAALMVMGTSSDDSATMGTGSAVDTGVGLVSENVGDEPVNVGVGSGVGSGAGVGIDSATTGIVDSATGVDSGTGCVDAGVDSAVDACSIIGVDCTRTSGADTGTSVGVLSGGVGVGVAAAGPVFLSFTEPNSGTAGVAGGGGGAAALPAWEPSVVMPVFLSVTPKGMGSRAFTGN
mmetsp:Transcript_22087/g.47641  ORF Transcript_22087/g.47641 Transcript_22087/m.47641 type:complete len:290 (+) Transcript_22087:2240-3109(+)